MEIAVSKYDTDLAIADAQRRHIYVLARDIGDWLSGIVRSIDVGSVKRADLGALQRELSGVERRLEQLTWDLILDP
jgi:hypothetical protein